MIKSVKIYDKQGMLLLKLAYDQKAGEYDYICLSSLAETIRLDVRDEKNRKIHLT